MIFPVLSSKLFSFMRQGTARSYYAVGRPSGWSISARLVGLYTGSFQVVPERRAMLPEEFEVEASFTFPKDANYC